MDKKSHKKPKTRKPATKLRKQASSATQSVTARKLPVLKEDSVPVYEVRGVRQAATSMDSASGRWDRARTQWQLGDWDSLAVAEAETLQDDPHRAELAALAACAHLQQGNKTEARRLLAAASRWHCPPEFLARALAAGVENNLARYHEACGHSEKSQCHLAASAGAFGGDGFLAATCRKALSSLPTAFCSKSLIESDNCKLRKNTLQTPTQISPHGIFYRPGLPSYSQNMEDVLLWRVLGHVSDGFFIDAGANDPTIHSVSKAFRERGWNGIHIEPLKEAAARLREDCPKDLVIEAALSDSHGISTMSAFQDDKHGLSTLSVEITELHQKARFQYISTQVHCVTLDDIFAAVGSQEIHWLKIDIEGYEKQAIDGWKFSNSRPWVIVIEATGPCSYNPVWMDWEESLLSKGYIATLFDGLNKYYCSEKHSELLEALSVPVNSFDEVNLLSR